MKGGTTGMLADSMIGDRRFGDTDAADKFRHARADHVPGDVAGFPNLRR